MSHHQQFYNFLGGLANGAHILATYTQYKTASGNPPFAYDLNGRLKANFPMTLAMATIAGYLRESICAQNSQPLTLYRMTSDEEFTGPLLGLINGASFKYQAFMSATGDINVLPRFVPSIGTPLVLEISCAPGTFMALMEAIPGQGEDEYLFGCGTEFSVIGQPTVVPPQEVSLYVGNSPAHTKVLYQKLSVLKVPSYAGKHGPFIF
jgi:hypothetical protein